MTIAEDLFQRAIDINQEAFNAGLYDASYHALMTALHCAEHLESDQPLLMVSQLASEQINWIDTHKPEYEHSTQTANKHHLNKSIFTYLSDQAKMMVKMRIAKRKRNLAV